MGGVMIQPLRDGFIERRRALGLSQREVARRSGIGQATISEWEAGHLCLSLGALARLAEVLGLEVTLVEKR